MVRVVSRVDLHIHSNFSDGKFAPGVLVRKAVDLGLNIIALSDHDSVEGVAQALSAARSYPGFKVIPGVEISTDIADGEIHILGYFIDYTNSDLLASLLRMRKTRVERAKKMVAKLANMGIYISWDRVQELAQSSSVGRPHLAQAMLEKGYIKLQKEAFTRYIGREGPAYVEREKMTPLEALRLIVKSGGLPVFAHPVTYKNYEVVLVELAAAGLIGIEAYYNNSAPEEIQSVLTLAEKFNLIPTGGSDFHGIEATEVPIGGIEVPQAAAERLIALARQRGLREAY